MPSAALREWQTVRQAALDELEAAHRSVGGTGPGRRYATQQINQAYAVLLSSQFQGYCRGLHTECIDSFLQTVPPNLQPAVRDVMLRKRNLDRGNPNPGTIGEDFNRFGLVFWDDITNLASRNVSCQNSLVVLNNWRNAIAHQDFDPGKLGGTFLRLDTVQKWRRACKRLAVSFDEVMRLHLLSLNGVSPW